jgi:hypothetical protein
MWTFFVELAEIVEASNGTDYPNLMFVHGQLPDTPPNKEFKAEQATDAFDLDDDDVDLESFDDLDFDAFYN